ncbi:virulence factor [Cocleimonas flava]|uniref:CvfA/B/C family virulence factor n=1 Tax=Cocleimonas flava TaxID=634765 RepID=A0A4R1EYK6_9GAMM|nr:virulence factor [Cocleimonas flava]TCJ84989.1 cvfA/B/C family virulence factor [Cocleimonas flava]
MPKIVIIYWRDIPSQVTVQEGRKRAKKLLPARFQEAIDRAAMRAKKIDSDAYLEDWKRTNTKQEGDINELVESVANQIEAEFTDEKLDSIVRNKGLLPENTDQANPGGDA